MTETDPILCCRHLRHREKLSVLTRYITQNVAQQLPAKEVPRAFTYSVRALEKAVKSNDFFSKLIYSMFGYLYPYIF